MSQARNEHVTAPGGSGGRDRYVTRHWGAIGTSRRIAADIPFLAGLAVPHDRRLRLWDERIKIERWQTIRQAVWGVG